MAATAVSSDAFTHEAGAPIVCMSIPVELTKDAVRDAEGNEKMVCGLRIGGGIDQDPEKSPYGYPDTGIYVTHIEPGGPAERAGLQQHDKLLQVNGHDFTLLEHKKAIHYVQKYSVLKMLVARKGLTS